jgi:hypothetical protein
MSDADAETYIPSYAREEGDKAPGKNAASRAMAAELSAVAQISQRKEPTTADDRPARPGTFSIQKPAQKRSWFDAVRAFFDRT